MKSKKITFILKMILVFIVSVSIGTTSYWLFVKEIKPEIFIVSAIPFMIMVYKNTIKTTHKKQES